MVEAYFRTIYDINWNFETACTTTLFDVNMANMPKVYIVYMAIFQTDAQIQPNSKFKHAGRESYILTTNKILIFTAADDR